MVNFLTRNFPKLPRAQHKGTDLSGVSARGCEVDPRYVTTPTLLFLHSVTADLLNPAEKKLVMVPLKKVTGERRRGKVTREDIYCRRQQIPGISEMLKLEGLWPSANIKAIEAEVSELLMLTISSA